MKFELYKIIEIYSSASRKKRIRKKVFTLQISEKFRKINSVKFPMENLLYNFPYI